MFPERGFTETRGISRHQAPASPERQSWGPSGGGATSVCTAASPGTSAVATATAETPARLGPVLGCSSAGRALAPVDMQPQAFPAPPAPALMPVCSVCGFLDPALRQCTFLPAVPRTRDIAAESAVLSGGGGAQGPQGLCAPVPPPPATPRADNPPFSWCSLRAPAADAFPGQPLASSPSLLVSLGSCGLWGDFVSRGR